MARYDVESLSSHVILSAGENKVLIVIIKNNTMDES